MGRVEAVVLITFIYTLILPVLYLEKIKSVKGFDKRRLAAAVRKYKKRDEGWEDNEVYGEYNFGKRCFGSIRDVDLKLKEIFGQYFFDDAGKPVNKLMEGRELGRTGYGRYEKLFKKSLSGGFWSLFLRPGREKSEEYCGFLILENKYEKERKMIIVYEYGKMKMRIFRFEL